MVTLLALLVLLGLGLTWFALRHRVLFNVGVRNIPRRPAQTMLIVLGLMLATLIISAAFGMGDTITYSIRSTVLKSLGPVDEVIAVDKGRSFGEQTAPSYFDSASFELTRQGLAGYDRVDGIAPAIVERSPVLDITTKQRESGVTVVGVGGAESGILGELVTLQEEKVSLTDLGDNEVYLNKEAARKLAAQAGDEIHLFAGPTPTALRVKAVLQQGATLSSGPSLLLPLFRVQEIFRREGQINRILISNRGGVLDGMDLTSEVVSRLENILTDTGLTVQPTKKEAIDEADTAGSIFTSVFVAFGEFSIVAGILLIFLIFVMLAAERQTELGIARAVGTKRHHLVQMFLFEGMIYDLLAAAVGAVLGVVVAYAMVQIMARVFGQHGLEIVHHFTPRSIIVAYTLGLLLTFIVVIFSSWRVSRLNIVRAVRNLPEPPRQRGSRFTLLLAVLLLVLGLVLAVSGYSAAQAFSWMLGTSFIIMSIGLLMRRMGLSERWAFTFVGITLLVWWLLPADLLAPVLPDFKMSLEMFFLSGIMIVAGAVWTTVYNSSILLRLLQVLLGRVGKLTPVLKIAVSYPMSHKFRTGMALAMFSLVIFTMIFMSVVIDVNTTALQNMDAISGGFQIQATTSYNNPVPDMHQAIASSPELSGDDFRVIASEAVLSVEAVQVGQEGWKGYVVKGVDEAYLNNNKFKFSTMAEGYRTPQEVWQALGQNPGLAVIDAYAVPSRQQFGAMMGGPEFRVQGVYLEDKTMEPIEVEVKDPRSGNIARLTIIGVIDRLSFFSFGIYTSQQTLNDIAGFPVPATTYFFALKDGVEVKKTSLVLESTFAPNGMDSEVIQEMVDEAKRTSRSMNTLLQGFMSLGLVVGVAALGVISARSVVERRQEIGMLRAIGFQKGMVQLSFLLESSFVAILGILIGVALGLALSYQVVDFIAKDIPGLQFGVPWLQVVVISALAYGASLVTTYLPARQAANIYPAQALRYE